MSPSAHHKDGGNAYRSAMDKVLEKNPPVIEWRTIKGGIKVAVSVVDPHTEGSLWKRRKDPAEPYLEYVDILAIEEAKETEDSPLLRAARTEI